MDDFPKMLYRAPGADVLTDSGPMATLIVGNADDCGAALQDGWFETSPEAAAAIAKPASEDAPPTRAELEQKATELGIAFDGRWGDKKLSAAIADKLKG